MKRLIRIAVVSTAILLIPTARAGLIYWTNTTNYTVSSGDSADGSGQQVVRDVSSTFGAATNPTLLSIAVDENILYLAEDKSDRIIISQIDDVNQRVNNFIKLDDEFGTRNYRPRDLAVDSEYIFWTDELTNIIYRADIDGGNAQEIALRRSGFAPGVSIDWSGLNTNGLTLVDDQVYWTSANNDKVYVMNRDGNDFDTFLNIDTKLGNADYNPSDITTDGTSLFWADVDSIYRADLLTTDTQLLVDLSGTAFKSDEILNGLTYNEGRIFWADPNNSGIFSALVDGSDLQTPQFQPAGTTVISDIAVFSVAAVPEPSLVLPLALGLAGFVTSRRRRRCLAS